MQTSSRQITPHGFTLIELLVVIGIIGVLMSLVYFAAAKMRVSARESQCRSELGALSGVAAMYEAATGQAIEHLIYSPYDTYWNSTTLAYNNGTTGTGQITKNLSTDETSEFSGNASEQTSHEQANLYIERFVWVALQIPQAYDRFAGLGDNAFVDLDNDGFMEIRDPWGHCIAYANRTTHSTTTDIEDNFLPNHPNPFFASAGADGLWGEAYTEAELGTSGWGSYVGSTNYKNSRDNLYSFDIDRSSAETQQ